MAELHYVTGDATDPQVPGPKTIAHICNDQGLWGAGFVLALSARWPEPEEHYRDWYRRHREDYGGGFAGFELGRVGLVRVSPSPDGIVVANMIAQRGVRRIGDPRAVSYTALYQCLSYLGACSSPRGGDGASVHMPRIGCGLGGGDWSVVGELVEDILVKRHGVETYVYDAEF